MQRLFLSMLTRRRLTDARICEAGQPGGKARAAAGAADHRAGFTCTLHWLALPYHAPAREQRACVGRCVNFSIARDLSHIVRTQTQQHDCW